uniref:non-specific serine/threonine protein kinase n=1 Tax=viral metagenome TaxID=1070528 RepID=A0A6C0I2I1_9ZZZZ
MLINDRYKLQKRIGSGTFGLVFSAKNVNTNETVAIKLEPTAQVDTLTHEAAVLMKLSGIPGIPNLRYYGVPDHNRYMAIDLLGKSLQTVSSDYKKSVPIGIVGMYAKQMVQIIQAVHERGFVHRDIKPPNFMTGGINKNESNETETHDKLFLIDFGMSRTYIDDKTNAHRCNKMRTTGIIGTPRYVSIHVHDGCEPSRRDDLISIMYVLIYLAKGRLPWKAAASPELVAQIKKTILPEDLFFEMPSSYLEIFKYLCSMSYDEAPDYSYIIENL